jgi:N-acetylglucosamine-6-sulfatase
LTAEQIAQLDEHYVKRVQSMQAVDEMILQITDELKRSEKLENTYIIFTSDNGYHMGQHRLKEGKGHPYEEDIVVPFVIRGPGIPKGAALDNYLSGNVDIAPTLADLAGIIPPNYVDGRSLVPLIFNNPPAQEKWRQAYLLEFYGDAVEAVNQSDDQLIGFGNEQYGLLEPPDWDQMQKSNLAPDYVGLRTIQYTFVKYRDGTLELYDLIKDPYELENLAISADKKMLEYFSSWVTDLSSCHEDQCTFIEDKKYP